MADNGNQGGIQMWPSESLANRLYDLSNLGLIGALVLGVACTVGVVWMGNVKERYFRERIANTERGTAEANERAAKANETAEKEKLARLQLEARLAPRSLSQAQQGDIRTRLTPHGPRTVDVLLFGNTIEIANIARQFFNSLPVGWTVRVWTTIGSPMAVSGFLVDTRSGSTPEVEAAANAIVAALVANGVDSARGPQFADGALPAALNGPNWDVNNVASVRLLIGGKP